jgi:hypothetical protein
MINKWAISEERRTQKWFESRYTFFPSCTPSETTVFKHNLELYSSNSEASSGSSSSPLSCNKILVLGKPYENKLQLKHKWVLNLITSSPISEEIITSSPFS